MKKPNTEKAIIILYIFIVLCIIICFIMIFPKLKETKDFTKYDETTTLISSNDTTCTETTTEISTNDVAEKTNVCDTTTNTVLTEQVETTTSTTVPTNDTKSTTNTTKTTKESTTTKTNTVLETTTTVPTNETTTIITDTNSRNFVKTFNRGTYYCYGCEKTGGSGRKLISCAVGDGYAKGSIASSYLYKNYGLLTVSKNFIISINFIANLT